MTSLGDDARETLWRKPRNDLWNNTYVYVLHKPGQCCVQVWISTCEQRSSSQPTPLEIGAVMSSPFSCSPFSCLLPFPALPFSCTPFSASLSPFFSASSHFFYPPLSFLSAPPLPFSAPCPFFCLLLLLSFFCLPPLFCPSLFLPRGLFEPRVSIFWWERKCSGWNPLSLRRREKFNTCGHCQFATFLESRWTLCLFATTPISRLTNLETC